MIQRINPWQALVGLAIVVSFPTALAIAGKLDAIGVVLVAAGSLTTLMLRFWREANAAAADAPPPTPRNDVPPKETDTP